MAEGPTNRLYVGNIPWSTTVDELRGIFSQCGTISLVDIPTGRQGRSRGYGIVEYSSVPEAQMAIQQLDGTSRSWVFLTSSRAIAAQSRRPGRPSAPARRHNYLQPPRRALEEFFARDPRRGGLSGAIALARRSKSDADARLLFSLFSSPRPHPRRPQHHRPRGQGAHQVRPFQERWWQPQHARRHPRRRGLPLLRRQPRVGDHRGDPDRCVSRPRDFPRASPRPTVARARRPPGARRAIGRARARPQPPRSLFRGKSGERV
jgi:hypothetical protein